MEVLGLSGLHGGFKVNLHRLVKVYLKIKVLKNAGEVVWWRNICLAYHQ